MAFWYDKYYNVYTNHVARRYEPAPRFLPLSIDSRGGEGRGRRIDRSLSVRFASLHVNHTESHREFRLRGRISYISMICPSAVYHRPIQTVLSRSRANVTGRLDEIRIYNIQVLGERSHRL